VLELFGVNKTLHSGNLLHLPRLTLEHANAHSPLLSIKQPVLSVFFPHLPWFPRRLQTFSCEAGKLVGLLVANPVTNSVEISVGD